MVNVKIDCIFKNNFILLNRIINCLNNKISSRIEQLIVLISRMIMINFKLIRIVIKVNIFIIFAY